MAPVVRTLRAYPERIESSVCVTGQHREMLDQVLQLFQIEPDIDLDVMTPGQQLPALTSSVLERVDDVLGRLQPDLVLVQGDTTTAMAASLAAFYRQVPVGHVEAGLRTSSRYDPFPEEINRRITDQLATLHFAPTQRAADALLAEGISGDRVYITGNTVIDALHWAVKHQAPTDVQSLLRSLELDGNGSSCKLILVTAHRRESFGRPLEEICLGLRDLVRRNPDLRLVFPVHLNPKVHEAVHRLLGHERRIKLIEPLPYLAFAHLMGAAYLILTDSGGIQEEAPSLGVPVLVLRHTTEREEAIDSGTAKLIGTDSAAIVREAERLLCDQGAYARMARADNPYGDGRAAKRIVSAILRWARIRAEIGRLNAVCGH